MSRRKMIFEWIDGMVQSIKNSRQNVELISLKHTAMSRGYSWKMVYEVLCVKDELGEIVLTGNSFMYNQSFKKEVTK